MKSPSAPAYSDAAIKALLERHHCPTPWPVVRAKLMGNIASPALQISPIDGIASLWGGELPEFESEDDAQELIMAIVMGLWNRLTAHQDSRTPFRLLRRDHPDTSRAGLLELASMRRSELAGFVDGLFGTETLMMFTAKAHEALSKLGDMHAMLGDIVQLLADETKPATDDELKKLARNLQQMTIAAEKLINTTILSCKRMRGQQLRDLVIEPMERPVFAHDDQEPDVIHSPLSQYITRHGVTVQVEIYGEGDGRWILEVIDAQGSSFVWDESFATDQEALDAAIQELEKNPIEFAGQAPDDGGSLH